MTRGAIRQAAAERFFHQGYEATTVREIADALYVSVGTVRSHMSALMHKVGAVDRDDLVAMVERAQRDR